MKDERYKEIMQSLGQPNSRSLLTALQQVANEVAQEVHAQYKHVKEPTVQADADGKCSNCGEPVENYRGGSHYCGNRTA